MKINRMICYFITAIFAFSLIPQSVFGSRQISYAQEVPAVESVATQPDGADQYSDDEILSVIVSTKGDALLDYYINEGGDYESASEYLLSQNGSGVFKQINDGLSATKKQIQRVAPSACFGYDYNISFTGFSLSAKYSDIKKIQELETVTDIESDVVYEPEESQNPATESEELKVQADGGITAAAVGTSSINLTSNYIYDSKNLEYKGKGMLIAVIDTGIYAAHEAFSIDPPNPKHADNSYLDTRLQGLKARTRYKGTLTATDLFISKKIPFAFDYGDNDINAEIDTESDAHGVHVSGIACGDNGLTGGRAFKGAAPEAQLAVLKAKGASSIGFVDSDIIAAMEDAVIIGADTINLSVGVTSGFISTSYKNVIAKTLEAGMTVCAAAGNAYSAATPAWGTATIYAQNPDYGTVSRPAVSKDILAVANFNENASNYGSSSWGTTSDLSLKPDITSSGENVNSAYSGGVSSYARFSGTSMSSPNVSGAVTLIKQMIKDKYPAVKGAESDALAKRLAMSTAYPMTMSGGIKYFSPRIQGAGFLDLENALNAKAYLYVNTKSLTKIELFDDPQKTGVYNMSFTLKNLSGLPRKYTLSTQTQTQYYNQTNGCITLTDVTVLNPAVGFEAGQGVVTVAAGAEAEISLTVTLTASDRGYLDKFPNGSYVEGFVFLTPDKNFNGDGAGENQKLSIPFMGFYGDWTQAPIFDGTIYEDRPTQYTNIGGGVQHGLYMKRGNDVTLMGAYKANDIDPAYLETLTAGQQERLEPQFEYLAMNYMQNGQNTQIYSFETALLRNIARLKITFDDPVTGNIFYSVSQLSIIKSLMLDSARDRNKRMEINYMLYGNMQNTYMVNNAVYNFTVSGATEYGDYENELHHTLTFPIYMDCETPVLLNVHNISVGGNSYIDVTTWDNHFTRIIKPFMLKNEALEPLGTYATPVIAGSYGQNVTTRINTTGYIDQLKSSDDGLLYLRLEDFAGNTQTVSVDVNEKTSAYSPKNRLVTKTAAELEAEPTTSGVAYRTLEGGGYELTSYTDSPSRTALIVKDGTVRIAPNALYNASSIQSISLPASLKRIGYGAFYNCASLKEVTFRGDAPLLEITYQSITQTNPHPYNHFKVGMDALPVLTLVKAQGAAGFESMPYQMYFNNSHMLTFDTAGAQEIPAVEADSGDEMSDLIPALSRAHYSFKGWYLDAEYTQPLEFDLMPDQSLTLYARWQIDSHTLSFDARGGSAIDPITKEYGQTVSAPSGPTRTGYTFAGWYTDQDYETGYVFEIMQESLTLYALWLGNDYTFTFNSRGGNEIDSLTQACGQAVTTPVDPARKGYIFTGWYTDAACANKYEFGLMPAQNITLYAGWQKEASSCGCGSIGAAGALPLLLLTVCAATVLLILKRRNRSLPL